MYDKKVIYIIIALFATLLITNCIVNYGYSSKFAAMSRTIDSCQQSNEQLGDIIGQQESTIAGLRELQSRLESTIADIESNLDRAAELCNTLEAQFDRTVELYNDLRDTEQGIDGYTGALRGTIEQLGNAIDLTLQGIESEGLDQ